MKLWNRCGTALFLIFALVNVYVSPTSSQQSLLQSESLDVEDFLEDAVLEEIARLVDVQNTDKTTIAKKILVLAKKPVTSENVQFVMNYLTYSLQQRLGNDTTINALSITNCAKLIIEDLVTVAGMAPTSEVKKKETESMFFSVSRIAILGCCAYIINMLFGVYSTLNSIFGLVNTATQAYSHIQSTIDSLSGTIKAEGMQTRSLIQSEFEELGVEMDEEKERILALRTQLEAQHQELCELQSQASVAQVAQLEGLTQRIHEAGARTTETLAKIQDSMVKLKKGQQRQQKAQAEKLQVIGVAADRALRETTEARIGIERVMGNVDRVRSKISETTRGVSACEQRVTGHVERVERGVSSVGDKVDRVSEYVAQMSKEQKEQIAESFRKLQEAVTPQQRAQAQKGFMDYVKSIGWEASMLVVESTLGRLGGAFARKGIEAACKHLGWGGSEAGVNVSVVNQAPHCRHN